MLRYSYVRIIVDFKYVFICTLINNIAGTMVHGRKLMVLC